MIKMSLHDPYGLILTIIVEIRSIFVELDYFFVKNAVRNAGDDGITVKASLCRYSLLA